jgi:porphobilinogen synthase
MRESFVSPSNFILPLFVHEDNDKNVPISSMPGVFRLAYGRNVVDAVAEARALGINQVVIFPKVSS